MKTSPSAQRRETVPQEADEKREKVAVQQATIALTVLAFSALVGCGVAQQRGPAAPSTAPAAQVSAPVSPPGPGDLTPDFIIDTVDHGPFTLSAQRGKPWIVFFTSST